MTKKTPVLVICSVLLFAAPLLWAAEYQVENLTDNSNSVWGLTMNNVGHIAWEESAGAGQGLSTFEIFLYRDETATRITYNDWADTYPQMNDAGHIAWLGEPILCGAGFVADIFYYDGSDIHQLSSDCNHDTNPFVNDAGQVIWEKHYPGLPYYGWMYLFDSTNFHLLAESNRYKQLGQLDDAGNAIWQVRFSGYERIYYYDGQTISPLTSGTNDQFSSRMNKRGQVVWVEDDGNDPEIFLWDSGTVTQITDNDYADYAPKLNELGQVTWTGLLNETSASAEVFLFDGMTTTQITNNELPDWSRDINVNGHVAVESQIVPNDFSSKEVFVYDGTDLIRVTFNDHSEFDISLNDLNQVGWVGYGTYSDQWGNRITDAFLARRIEPIEVLIDIKPSSFPNCFNNNGNGVIPVAILGSDQFDVSQVDAATVSLANLQIKAVGKSDKLLASLEDYNGDGFMDLIVKIEDEDGVFEVGEAEATLTGKLLAEFDSLPIVGTDSICIVP